MAILTKFADAFRKQSIKDLRILYAPDSDVVVIGSDVGEKCVGIQEITALFKEYFDNFEELTLEYRGTTVSAAGTVAWVATDDIITLKTSKQVTTKTGRLTFVLEKRHDAWLILQVHHSVP